MSYDKYRNWPLPVRQGNIYRVYSDEGLQPQVLRDLAATQDEVEKLEILDSYAAYAQRVYQAEVAGALASVAGRILNDMLEPLIISRLSPIGVPARARIVKEAKGKAQL